MHDTQLVVLRPTHKRKREKLKCHFHYIFIQIVTLTRRVLNISLLKEKKIVLKNWLKSERNVKLLCAFCHRFLFSTVGSGNLVQKS